MFCSERRDPIETIIKCSLYLCCQGQQFLIQYCDVTTETHRIIYDVTQKGSTSIVTSYSMIFHVQIGVKLIWARSQRCGCLVTWFCYQLIAKPTKKIAALLWPDPYSPVNINIEYWYPTTWYSLSSMWEYMALNGKLGISLEYFGEDCFITRINALLSGYCTWRKSILMG